MSRRRHNRNPLPKLPKLGLGAPSFGMPIALATSAIIDRMTAHRLPVIEQVRGTFSEEIFSSVAEYEQMFGLLTKAPLSPEQARQERVADSMQLRTWDAEDFSRWVNARTL